MLKLQKIKFWIIYFKTCITLHIHVVGEWVCSARVIWVVLSCAGVWPEVPCSTAAECCGCLHAATSHCGGWSCLKPSLQSIVPIQKCFLLCSGFSVILDCFRALSLAYWCLIVFACIVMTLVDKQESVTWAGKDSGKAWLPCN